MKRLLNFFILAFSALWVSAQTISPNEKRLDEFRQRLNIDYSMPDFCTSNIDSDIIGLRLAKMLKLLTDNSENSLYKSFLSSIVCEQIKELKYVNIERFKIRQISKKDDTISISMIVKMGSNTKNIKSTRIVITFEEGVSDSLPTNELFTYLGYYIKV